MDQPELLARFHCSVCHASAGEISVVVGPGKRPSSLPHGRLIQELDEIVAQAGAGTPDARVAVDSFLGTRVFPITGDERIAQLVAAVTDGDAPALYALGYSCAPFFCPECSAVYCGTHWKRKHFVDDDHGLEGTEGHCPAGHFHILDY